jgi:hypothetical protein
MLSATFTRTGLLATAAISKTDWRIARGALPLIPRERS